MVSVCQRLRGNEKWNEPGEHYADCADTCTYSQVLKLIHSGFSWIKTMIFVLVTGLVLLVLQAIFKVESQTIHWICLMIA